MAQETIKLQLRLPVKVHRHATAAARRRGISLNTYIVNTIAGPPTALTDLVKWTVYEVLNQQGSRGN